MSLLDNVYQTLEENRQNVLDGNINGIPFLIPQFRSCIPIIKKGQFHLVTALTKHSKTQLTNHLFLYHILDYAYEHKDQIKVKFFYFNWEESAEEILMRYMVRCLYDFTDKSERISSTMLQSPDKEHLLSEENLNRLKSFRYKDKFEFFTNCVEFCGDDKTSVATDIRVKSYARENGTITYKQAFYKDDNGEKHETKAIDTYTPNNPNEYVFIIYDHLSLCQPIMGQSLMQAMATISKQCVYYKNIFKFVPIIIQQQSKELAGIEASKQSRVRPEAAFLSDCKSTVNDCTHFWGITDPVSFNLETYYDYDLKKLGHNFRMLELIINRWGEGNKMCPLYFDGAVNYFCVLPMPSEKDKLEVFYKRIQLIKESEKRHSVFLIQTKNKKLCNYQPKKAKLWTTILNLWSSILNLNKENQPLSQG